MADGADFRSLTDGKTQQPSHYVQMFRDRGRPLLSDTPTINEQHNLISNTETGSINDINLNQVNGLLTGGVNCDEENDDFLGFQDYSDNSSSQFQPRLAFLDSDENISHQINESESFCQQNRSSSAKRKDSSSTEKSVKQTELHANPANLTVTRQSFISQHSSDSDLITDLSSQFTTDPRTADPSVPEEDSETCHKNISEEDHFIKNWHCHRHGLKMPLDKMARNQLIAVSVLCFLFMVGETVGGVLSNSLALFTDVLHLGSDLISFLISLLSIYLAKKPATRNMSFGYHRAEVLGALVSVFIIWSVTGVLVYVAIERIIHEHYKDVKADEMLITATIGVVFNIIMGIVLHSEICCGGSGPRASFGHGHSHGASSNHSHSHRTENNHCQDSHGDRGDRRPLLRDDEDMQLQDEWCTGDYQMEEEEPPNKPHPKNINVRAAFIHVIGDIIQSLGVLLAAIIIKLKPEEKYRLADPICTFLFSVLVLFTTFTVLRDTLRIILEGVPQDVDYYSIKMSLQKLDGVKAIHGLTVWCLTLEKNALAVHIGVDPSVSHQQVLAKATEVIRRNYNFIHMTIQVEDYKPSLSVKCTECQELKK